MANPYDELAKEAKELGIPVPQLIEEYLEHFGWRKNASGAWIVPKKNAVLVDGEVARKAQYDDEVQG